MITVHSAKHQGSISTVSWVWSAAGNRAYHTSWHHNHVYILSSKHTSQPISVFYLSYFKSFKCDKLYELILKKRFLWEPEKLNFKFHRNLDNAVKIVTSKLGFILRKLKLLKFVTRPPIRTFSLEFFYVTQYIYSPWKVWKRMQLMIEIILV